MTFGDRIRELRKAKNRTLRDVADEADINFTYLSKIENGKLDFSDFPSEKLIRKLADILDGDVDELLLLAQKVPDEIKQRVLERPDAFRKIAKLDDETLDRILGHIEEEE
ncbi:MAG: helix-turn-helix transcriptional regulator [Planctomycetaceae bacterium]|nr:helix-turn-helix transcriptional regulator [Planctomycetaceae bacterium]